MRGGFSIFADEAGVSEFRDHGDGVVVLAAMLLPCAMHKVVAKRMDALKAQAAQMGVDTSDPRFEFRAYDLLQPARMWRGVNEDDRRRIAIALRRLATRTSYAMVLADRACGGRQGIARFNEFLIRCMEEDPLATDALRAALDPLVAPDKKDKTLGTLGNLTALFLGYTNALAHRQGPPTDGTFTADEQFFTQLDAWGLVFRIMRSAWPLMKEEGVFFNWPPTDPPDWHLGALLRHVDSRMCYGVQLADFVAYTTKRRWLKGRRDMAGQMAIAGKGVFKPLGDYQGIFVSLPSPSERQPDLTTAEKQFWRWRLFHRE